MHFMVSAYPRLQAFGLTTSRSQQKKRPPKPQKRSKALGEKRWAARQAKDWAASDELRDELAAHGWTAKDGKDSYTLHKI